MLLFSSLALPPPTDGLRVLSLDLRRSLLAYKVRKVRVKVNAGFLLKFVNGNRIFLEVASITVIPVFQKDRTAHIACESERRALAVSEHSLVIMRRNCDFLAYIIEGIFSAQFCKTACYDIAGIRAAGPGTN